MKKFDFLKNRKFHQGSISVALTATIIILVVLINSLFGILASRFYWGIDLSGGYFFTLTEQSKELLSDAFSSLPESRKAQNLRYEEKNKELIENVNAKIDELNAAASLSLQKLTAESYSSESVASLNAKIEELNKSSDKKLDTFTYRPLTSPAPENAKIKIIFCDDEDDIKAQELYMYVLETAKQLKAEFPNNIDIEFVNIYANPSAVSKYKTSTLTQINSTDIIIESGNEYRLIGLESFYAFESDDTVWAYNGEKKFASAILALAQAEAPVAGVLLNHGETFYDDALITLLYDAGYSVQSLDLSKEEIPEECRLILCYNPDKDFLGSDDVGEGEKSEISALEEFMKRDNTSFMVFVSPETPKLKNLEEFLDLWGVTFDRTTVEGKEISNVIKESPSNTVTSDGYSNIGSYVTNHIGANLTSDMREAEYPAKVIFRNAMSISYSDHFILDRGTDDVTSLTDDRYTSSLDGASRYISNVFTSSASAAAYADGKEVSKANDAERYIYMTLSEDAKGYTETVDTPTSENGEYIGTETAKTSSYVVTFTSVEFATKQYLESASYGNSELLLRTLREMGKDALPISLPIKPFEDTKIEGLTAAAANAWTVTLAVIPVFAALASGIYILVRRKNR